MIKRRQWAGFALTAFAAVTAVSLRAGHDMLPDVPVLKEGGYSVLMAGTRQTNHDVPDHSTNTPVDDAITRRTYDIQKSKPS